MVKHKSSGADSHLLTRLLDRALSTVISPFSATDPTSAPPGCRSRIFQAPVGKPVRKPFQPTTTPSQS